VILEIDRSDGQLAVGLPFIGGLAPGV